MKKLLYLLMPLLAIASCEKPEVEPEPVVGKITLQSEETLIFSDEGESKSVAFEATLEWTASSSEDFIVSEPDKGQAGKVSITLTAGQNESYDPRTATVTLKCGEDQKTIQITQKQKGALLLTESSLSVPAEGGKVSIIAKANSNVKAEVAQDAQDWISEVKLRGLVEYNFDFQVAANESEEPRSGQIVFSNESGNETITINQEGVEPKPEGNVYGTVSCNGEGLAGVLVSDGIQIVETDENGMYYLNSTKETRFVYVILPSGYEVNTDGVLPQFYHMLSDDVNALEEKNFELYKVDNDNFTLLVCGDMQLANRTSDLAQFDKVAMTLNEVAASKQKVYGLTLGDMTWEKFWLSNNYGLDEYIATMNKSFGTLPFFHTMGNHDNEYEVAGDFAKSFLYTQKIAPTYYSFNLGKVHFIVLDNMDFSDAGIGSDDYHKNITKAQLDWLVKDLSYVDKSTPVFVAMHEVLQRPDGNEGWKETLDGKDVNLAGFIEYFSGYETHVLTGHTHCLFNHTHAPNFYEHNGAGYCASWWWSGYRTPGIHIGIDGSPGGFGVWDFTGTEFKWNYRAANQSEDYQFRAYDMNKVKEAVTMEMADNKSGFKKHYDYVHDFDENMILVNVWDYDENWTVEIEEEGTPLTVNKVSGRDPLHIVALTAPRFVHDGDDPNFTTAKWTHFFEAKASRADSEVKVTVTDRNGKVYSETMVRPKALSIAEYKNAIDYSELTAAAAEATSSTLVFTWTTGVQADDPQLPYRIALYNDAACTDVVVSFDIEESHSCWDGNKLKFVFAGLESSKEYWFVATDTAHDKSSAPVSSTTKAFTPVAADEVSSASVGDVILAEDFSEIGWGSDEIAKAAGFEPSSKSLAKVTGAKTSADGSYREHDANKTRLFDITVLEDNDRLADWGFCGNSAVYAYAGYLRCSASSSGSRTHVVSPALTAIPKGMVATIDVSVTTCLKDSGNDTAVFLEDYSSLSASPVDEGGYKYTGVSFKNGYPLNALDEEWTTRTVRIEGVTAANCLVFGSYENVDKKNRFCITDVEVKVVELVKPERPVVYINTPEDLVNAAKQTVEADVYLMKDLDMTGVEYNSDNFNLYGSFDGGNYAITGLTQPLFNNIYGSVRNLTLTANVEYAGAGEDAASNNHEGVGLLAHYAYVGNVADQKIENVTVNGSLTVNFETSQTDYSIGGFVGGANGVSFKNCVNNAAVAFGENLSGTNFRMGGIAGTVLQEVTLESCKNTGAITAANGTAEFNNIRMGGLVGYSENNLIAKYAQNSGVVTFDTYVTNAFVGGVAGLVDGKNGDISYAENTGNVTVSGSFAGMWVAGVLGSTGKINADYIKNAAPVTVKNAEIRTSVWLAGCIGRLDSGVDKTEFTIQGMQNSGAITIKENVTNESGSWQYIGGVLGSGDTSNKTLKNCHNTGNVDGRPSSKQALKVRMGGLAGIINRNPDGSSSKADVKFYGTRGSCEIGGLVGYLNTSTYKNLIFKGTVYTNGTSGTNYVGGLVGNVKEGTRTFENCAVYGTIHGANNDTGAGVFYNAAKATTATFKSCKIGVGTHRKASSGGTSDIDYKLDASTQLTEELALAAFAIRSTEATVTDCVVVDPSTF